MSYRGQLRRCMSCNEMGGISFDVMELFVVFVIISNVWSCNVFVFFVCVWQCDGLLWDQDAIGCEFTLCTSNSF